MGCYRPTYRAPPCPGCGKPDAARMGSSAWGHNLSCCGDVCGLKVRDALTEMRQDERFKFFTLMVEHADLQLGALRREYLEELRDQVSSPPDSQRPGPPRWPYSTAEAKANNIIWRLCSDVSPQRIYDALDAEGLAIVEKVSAPQTRHDDTDLGGGQ
jgi:hypothetical protein